jgi:hypothetical protein
VLARQIFYEKNVEIEIILWNLGVDYARAAAERITWTYVKYIYRGLYSYYYYY